MSTQANDSDATNTASATRHVCESCRTALKADDMVVVVRQQAVSHDARQTPSLVDVGPPLFFHERHWAGATFRTRCRVQTRGRLGAVTKLD